MPSVLQSSSYADLMGLDEAQSEEQYDTAHKSTEASDPHIGDSSSASSERAYKAESSPMIHWSIVIGAIVCFLSLIALAWAWNRCYYRIHYRPTRSEADDRQQRQATEKATYSWDNTLLMHPSLPWYLRATILIACLLNIALYIDSNQEHTASTVLLTLVTESTSTQYTLFSMGLVRTIDDMWHAKTYALAILLSFFSGGWPYIKVMSLLLAFVLPVEMMSISFRQKLLQTMDAFGKLY